jgi:PAS domain S-box-containing protein
MKILYVEDEIPHVELTQRTLEDNLSEAFVLLHCDSYNSAIKLLHEVSDIDIVLTDLRLPDGSGLDLLTKIREMHLPPAVILVTGQGDEQMAVAALKAGAADYLVKQSDYLLRLPFVITNAVAQQKLEQEKAAKQEAEVRYRSLVEQIPAVVFLDDVDDNETTLYISPRIEELTGFSPEKWQSESFIWENHIHPDDRESILEADRDTHQSGNRFEEEYRFIRSDGQTIWIKDDTNLIRDKEGNPLYWQGILIDITQEKETAAALERQLRELTVLNAVTLAGAEGASEDEIIERVVKLASLIFNEVTGVLLLNEQGDLLTPHQSYFGANVSNWIQGTPTNQGVTGKCVETGMAIRLGDITTEPAFIEIATDVRSELCVPIRVNNRIIGVFNVESKKRDAYDNEDEQFLTTVAGSLGTALERLRLFNEEQQRNKELNALYQSTKSLTQSLKPDIIAASLLSIMDELLGYEFASIYLLDEQLEMLLPLAISPKAKNLDIYEIDMELLHTESRPLGQGIIGWVAKYGQPIRSGDVRKDERYLPVISNILSELCVPLIARDKVVGAINIETTQLNAYSRGDENLLTALANSAAIALDNAQLYEAADLRRKEADSLREATASLSLHIEIEPLLDQILDSVFKIVPFDSASIFLQIKSGSDMEIIAARGFRAQDKIVGRIVPKSVKWDELALTRKALILPDAQADPLFEKWNGSEKIRGWMGVPMISQDKIVGFINLDSHKVNTYTERDGILIQTFANSSAVAIQNAILFKTEREQRKREETMLELMRITTSSLELEEVMRTILKHMADLIPSDSGTIQLLEGDELRIAAAQGYEEGILVPGQMLGLQDSAVKQRALSTTQPVWTNNIGNDDGYKFMVGAENINSFMAIPLVYKDTAIGLATLDSHAINRYSPEDAEFALAIANQAAIAIGNAKLYQEALMASERRAVLHSISQDVVRFTQNIEQIYWSIHEAAGKLMPCDVFRIALRDNAKKENNFVYTMENGRHYSLPNEPANKGMTGRVIDTGKGLILHTEEETDLYPRFGSEIHVRSAVAVPMQIGGNIIGMISAQSYKQNSYGEEEQALLEMLATHAATAIENTRLYTETQRRLKALETINRLSLSLRTTQSQSEMCRILLEETLEILGTKNGSVWIYDPSTNMIVQRAAKGIAGNIVETQIKPNEGIVGHVFSSGKPYISTDLKRDRLLYSGNREAVTDGFGGAGIPIYSTDGILGMLLVEVESSRSVEDHLGLLATLAEIGGNAIHRADLFEQSQDQIHKLTTLRDIDSAIASSTDLRVTLNILMDHTIRHLKVDAVDILLYHTELQSLSYLSSTGFKTPSPSRPLVRIGEGLAGQVVMKGQIVQIPDLRETTQVAYDPLILREGFVSYIGIPLIVKGQIKGLFEIFSRIKFSPDHRWMEFMHTLSGQAAIAIDNSQLFDNLQRSNQEIRQAYDTTLEGWARALELRDRETEGHTRRVTELTMRLAQFMNIREDELVNINRGVLLHDIGKMGVPDQILRKTGPLTETEWVEMRKHPQYAYDLLTPIPYLRPALDIPYCHHEHWDGSGYPRGLKATQIPLSARLFSIVDIWDALLSDRPYRNAWPRAKVLEYLNEISGTILDPTIVRAFLEMITEDVDKNGIPL